MEHWAVVAVTKVQAPSSVPLRRPVSGPVNVNVSAGDGRAGGLSTWLVKVADPRTTIVSDRRCCDGAPLALTTARTDPTSAARAATASMRFMALTSLGWSRDVSAPHEAHELAVSLSAR